MVRRNAQDDILLDAVQLIGGADDLLDSEMEGPLLGTDRVPHPTAQRLVIWRWQRAFLWHLEGTVAFQIRRIRPRRDGSAVRQNKEGRPRGSRRHLEPAERPRKLVLLRVADVLSGRGACRRRGQLKAVQSARVRTGVTGAGRSEPWTRIEAASGSGGQTGRPRRLRRCGRSVPPGPAPRGCRCPRPDGGGRNSGASRSGKPGGVRPDRPS